MSIVVPFDVGAIRSHLRGSVDRIAPDADLELVG